MPGVPNGVLFGLLVFRVSTSSPCPSLLIHCVWILYVFYASNSSCLCLSFLCLLCICVLYVFYMSGFSMSSVYLRSPCLPCIQFFLSSMSSPYPILMSLASSLCPTIHTLCIFSYSLLHSYNSLSFLFFSVFFLRVVFSTTFLRFPYILMCVHFHFT